MFQRVGANMCRSAKLVLSRRLEEDARLSGFKGLIMPEDAQARRGCTEGTSVHGTRTGQSGSEVAKEDHWLCWAFCPTGVCKAAQSQSRWEAVLSSSDEKKFEGETSQNLTP